MQFLKLPSKTKPSSPLLSLILISSSFCIIYLLISIFLFRTSILPLSQDVYAAPTSIEHIVFGIASNKNSWPKKKEYVKLWWKPNKMRGCVFLESMPPPDTNSNDSSNSSSSSSSNNSSSSSNNTADSLPPTCISEDTSRFRYTYRGGLRSAIRVARVVLETVALNHSDVRWFVFGDDDTVFFPDNLVKTLGKYDHGLWYYIGTNSEIYEQNSLFSFGMAFGGAGFAISYPLAKVLAKVFDSCIERYPHLYGSDSRVYSCLAELGVGLTQEPGFHQLDIRGDIFGLLAAHPTTPLLSLHHLDHTDPIFPNMTTNNAIQHLFKAVNIDSQRILQQTICYDRWFSWTISVSWGYAVQVFQNHQFLPDALGVQRTFRPWKKNRNVLAGVYNFNTKEIHPDLCRRPTVFFLDSVGYSSSSSSAGGRDDDDGIVIESKYKRNVYENCSFDMGSPKKLEEVRVFSKKMELDFKQLKAPRRHCCDVLPSSSTVMEIAIRECKEEELIYMH